MYQAFQNQVPHWTHGGCALFVIQFIKWWIALWEHVLPSGRHAYTLSIPPWWKEIFALSALCQVQEHQNVACVWLTGTWPLMMTSSAKRTLTGFVFNLAFLAALMNADLGDFERGKKKTGVFKGYSSPSQMKSNTLSSPIFTHIQNVSSFET